jgi:hypothetical protein
MAYVISASLEQDPSPYPWCKVRKDRAPGQELVAWNNIDSEPIPLEWRPRSVLHADYVPQENYAPDNPDISYVSGGALCVSVAVRDMIEALEPNVHEFFPVDIYGVDGVIREPRRYILNVCQRVDAIVDGTSSVLSNGERLYHSSSLHPLKIRRQDVSHFHLWRDKHLSDNKIFFSEALYRQIADAGYAAFDLGIAEEI